MATSALVAALDPYPTTHAANNSATVQSITSPAAPPLLTQEIQLTGDQLWVDTAIDILPGQRLQISASGTLRYPDAKSDNTPAGLARSFKDLLRNLPDNDAGRGALLARIGEPDIAEPFLIGANRDIVAPIAGRLSIGINQTSEDTADGTYTVEIAIYAPAASFTYVAARIVPAIPGIDESLFAKIPRRASDKSGNPGDMVNFLILGSSAAMEKAFKNAGWVKVDADVKDTLLSAAIASMSKKSYLTMPMSPLYLFTRTQDYGWAHAEPLQVVATRHHLRLWKAPFTLNGETLWLGAATHDVGFAHDQRSPQRTAITHKIDPNIDQECDYVEKTLTATGQVAEITKFLPQNPVQAAKTATGGEFHSSGQVLVLQLTAFPDTRVGSPPLP